MEKKTTAGKINTTSKETIESKVASKKVSLSIDVFDMAGNVVETFELPEEVFGVKPNKNLMAQAVRVYLANQRVGTASTKGRGDVRGGGRKPWRQKGTGRARTGSIRDPHWRGGGVVHGPHPRDFSLEMPKTMKKKALISALSNKVLDKALVILQKIDFKEAKTKEAAGLLKNINVSGKAILAAKSFEDKEMRALKNLRATTTRKVAELNTYEVLNTKKLILTKEAVEEISKVLVK